MKKIIISILVTSSLLSIIFFITGCSNNGKNSDSYISQNILEKFSEIQKIKIKKNNGTYLGETTDNEIISEIVDIISQVTIIENFTSLNESTVILEIYDNKELIDEIYFWPSKNTEIFQIKSNDKKYKIIDKNLSLIIEEITKFKFYTLYDYSDICNHDLELFYEDSKNKYYLECHKIDKIFIEFLLTKEKMLLKDALEKNYISINELLESYPKLFIKKYK